MLLKSDRTDVTEFEWGRIEWLASRNLGNSEAMTFGRVTIRAGRANPRHSHPNCEEVLHLASGTLIHTLGEKEFTLNAGDTIAIAPGLAHNAAASGEADAVMYVAFSSADRRFELEQ